VSHYVYLLSKSKVFVLTFVGLLATLTAQSRDSGVARDDFQKGLSMAARIGLELAVTILVGALLGYALDRWLSTRPWFMLVGMLLGTIAGFRNVYRAISEYDDSKKE
jgi:ATP synthase protein I